MKKKKPKHAQTAPIDIDLETLIQSHNKFFDHLIELIPPRFYQEKDDGESKPWYQGLSKAAKASLKQQTKENLKLARKARFDPDPQPETAKAPLQSDEESVPNNVEEEGGEEKSKAVTYEELRMKLRAKIESLRGNRGEKKGDNDRKRKRGVENGGGGQNRQSAGSSEGNAGGEEEDDNDDDEEIIEYGKVRLDDEGQRKKRKKLPKAKELERAEKLRETRNVNPRVAWKTAADRAMGVKVHDNPQLIKASMKKEKKKREKNAKKWKERVETQEKMKGERQMKRKDNIVGRINEKKRRKIEKREKKLMRPGFEGRKEGYITKD